MIKSRLILVGLISVVLISCAAFPQIYRRASVSVDHKWVSIAAGKSHSLAIKSDGTLCAWGGNGHGQLGDGTTTERYSPVQIDRMNVH